MSKNDGGSGAATIDMAEVQKGNTTGLATADIDKLDFGDEVDETPDEAAGDEGGKKTVAKTTAKKTPAKKAASEKEEDPPEEEDEEVAEDEEADAGDEDEEDPTSETEGAPAKKEVKMVPAARMMHVKNQRDALEARLREANNAIEELRKNSADSKKAEAYEEKISEMYTQLETLRAAGDVEGAAKMARELDKLKDAASSRQSATIAQIEARNQLEQRLYDSVVQQLELVAPAVNPDAPEYDDDLVRAMDAMTRGYEAQGHTPSEALKQAATRLLGKDIFSDKSIRREKQPEPKKTNFKKNAEAIKKTPPSSPTEERTEKAQELKASSLTREEFAKLPEATQRRLLGDEV